MATPLIHALRCSITGATMRDPVILRSSGLSYERSAIEQWIRDYGTDPESGEMLLLGDDGGFLIENPCLKGLIEAIVAAGILPA